MENRLTSNLMPLDGMFVFHSGFTLRETGSSSETAGDWMPITERGNKVHWKMDLVVVELVGVYLVIRIKKRKREDRMPSSPTLFDLVGYYLPKIPGRFRTKLLYNCTSHPCGDKKFVRQQIIRLSKETDGTLEGCMAFAKREFDRDAEVIASYDPEENENLPEEPVDPYADQ